MNVQATAPAGEVSSQQRSVQGYIDETPVWSGWDDAAEHTDDRHAVAHLVARRRR